MLDDDQMAIMTGLGTGGTVINGNRGNSNNLTVDGGFNLDSGSNASMINNVGIDFIDQVAIQTSNFAADKGRNAGASINVVTQERHQPLRRQRVRDVPERQAPRGELLRAEGPERQADQGEGGLPRLRRRLRRSDRQEQAVLLHRHGVQVARSPGSRRSAGRCRPAPSCSGDFSARILGPDGVAGNADDNNIANSLINPATGQAVPEPHHSAEHVHR